MSNQETPNTFDQVYDLYVRKAKRASEITAMFKGRVAASTVRDYIQKAIREAEKRGDNIPLRETGKGGFQPLNLQSPISQRHRTIGARLNYWRTMSQDIKAQTFCQTYEFANHTLLRKMELGLHDFTLGELLRISEIIQIPLATLMETPSTNVVDPGRRPL